MKNLIASSISLKFFDPIKRTKVTCDASQYGLGATLEQFYGDRWLPIAFASRTMTSAEQNYSQLEKINFIYCLWLLEISRIFIWS